MPHDTGHPLYRLTSAIAAPSENPRRIKWLGDFLLPILVGEIATSRLRGIQLTRVVSDADKLVHDSYVRFRLRYEFFVTYR
ncbi:MAG: hypothetical protein AAF194_04355 [Pseudomonadota bacterium]